MPREIPYKGYTIEAASYKARREDSDPWRWVAKAIVVRNNRDIVEHQPLTDAQARFFDTQEEADALAFQLGRVWIDERC
jgi:hypothetical protein